MLDVETGRELQNISHAKQRSRGLAFSPDDRTIAVTDYSDVVALYDVATGAAAGELRFPKSVGSPFVAFTPDGRTLAAVGIEEGGNSRLYFWELATRKYRGTLQDKDENRTRGFRFSPDGKTLVTLSPWSEPALWDTGSRTKVRQFSGAYSAMSAAFCPDGKTLFTGTNHGTILAWDIATGRLLPASASPGATVTGLKFSPEGRKLIGFAERAITWDIDSGIEVGRGPAVEADFRITVPSPDGRLLAGTVDGVIRLWDASTGKEVRRLEGGRGGHRAEMLLFMPNSRRVLTADKEKRIAIWDIATGQVVERLVGQTSWVTRMVVSNDGRRLASAGSGDNVDNHNSIVVWDLTTNKEIRRFTSQEWQPASVAFSPDGRTLAAGCSVRHGAEVAGEIHVWDLESGREVRTFAALPGLIVSIAFSPDGRVIVAGDANGRLILFEVDAGKERWRFRGHTGWINQLAFAPDGRMLASASNDVPVYLWDVYGRSQQRQPATLDDMNKYWVDLAGADAEKAFEAIRRLIAAPDGVPVLRERLTPTSVVSAAKVNDWIQKLDSAKFTERQTSATELDVIADQVVDQLQVALSVTKSAEVRRSLQTILDRLRNGKPEILRALRAVEVLEQIATPAARDHLKSLANGAPGATLTRAAADALKRLQK